MFFQDPKAKQQKNARGTEFIGLNSSFNGWDGFTPLHNDKDNSYDSGDEYAWVDWYTALMTDEGLDGKGFKPESFFAAHYPSPEITALRLRIHKMEYRMGKE